MASTPKAEFFFGVYADGMMRPSVRTCLGNHSRVPSRLPWITLKHLLSLTAVIIWYPMVTPWTVLSSTTNMYLMNDFAPEVWHSLSGHCDVRLEAGRRFTVRAWPEDNPAQPGSQGQWRPVDLVSATEGREGHWRSLT